MLSKDVLIFGNFLLTLINYSLHASTVEVTLRNQNAFFLAKLNFG